MEFLELILLFVCAFLIYKKPQHECLAFGLLCCTAALVSFLIFALDLQYNLLPAFNL